MKYDELVKALQWCKITKSGFTACRGCPFDGQNFDCEDKLHDDAAAAIEALQAEVERLKAELAGSKDAIRILKHNLEMKKPKRGEWIWDDKRCIYVCSVCGSPKVRENMDRQIIKEQAYCYSCGAKMGAQE